MQRFLIAFWICLCALLLPTACNDELATSASDQPALSTDTLQLGTILAGNSSKTYQVKLYNRCSDYLKLTSIALRNAAESGFRMNVDGMNGTTFSNSELLRIAPSDSLFIFVEATFPETGSGFTQHTDYIDIICNSRQQTIVLTATSKDVLKLQGAAITSNTTWQRGTEVQIFDSLYVAPGVSLTLEDSVTLYMHDKADIIVEGTLQIAGTLQSRTTIRGDRTDDMFEGRLPYDNLPSQWGTLYLRAGGELLCRYADIHGMTDGVVADTSTVRFENCRIKNSGGNLITSHMCQGTFQNCELSSAAGALFEAYGGAYSFTHCTLASYNFAASIKKEAVHLCNIDTAQVWLTPLTQCDFVNTIIWGEKFVPDVDLDYIKVQTDQDAMGRPVYADSLFCYRFDHCLLHAKGEDDDDFIQTLWNEDPLFLLIDNDEKYLHDFHLQAESPARDKGIATALTLDLDGQPRSDTPCLGCYEFVK